MDYNKTLEVVLTALLGGGGLVGLLNWWRGHKSKKRGVSGVEHVAVSQASKPPIPLGTPDWEALTRYWQRELRDLREEFRKHKLVCERDAVDAEHYIDDLQAFIWRTTGEDPPARRKGEDKNG